MYISKCLYSLKEINIFFWFTNLVARIICLEYWFRIAAKRSLSNESIRIKLFKKSHLRVPLPRNYFLGLWKPLQRKNFRAVASVLAAQPVGLALPISEHATKVRPKTYSYFTMPKTSTCSTRITSRFCSHPYDYPLQGFRKFQS